MQEKTKKLITLLMLALALVGTVLAVLFAMKQDTQAFYWSTYSLLLGLFGAAILLIVVFFVLALMKDKKKLVKTLIGLVAAIAVIVVLYLISPATDVRPDTMVKYEVTNGIAKFVGAAIYLVYALVAVAAIAIVYVECNRAFRKK